MNYYIKYLKYKNKYLNLLEKTKRKLEDIQEETIQEEDIQEETIQERYIQEGDIQEDIQEETIQEEEIQEETNKKKMTIENSINVPDRDRILSGLLNIFVNESLYELSENYFSNNDLDNIETLDGKKIKKKGETKKYNLRNVEFQLRRENSDFYIGSYTPEIIGNFFDNGLDSTTIFDLINNFHEDDLSIIKSLNEQNPLYINFDNNGKIIECWIADNMCCPCCGEKSLRRYVKENIPCIDLMCINPEHKFTDGVKFFQVKAKSITVENPLHKNFDYSIKQIHTGSKAIGQYIHDIAIDDEYNVLLMGYICIEYEKIRTEENDIIRILNRSFITLPKIYFELQRTLFSDEEKKYNYKLGLIKEDISIIQYESVLTNKYYWYVDNNPKNYTIEFNTNNNDIIFFKNNKNILFGENFSMNFITTDYNPISERWIVIPNPFVL
jgi:hypothetical protein